MPKDYLCAAHNKDLPRFRHAIEEKASELSDFAQASKARTQACSALFDADCVLHLRSPSHRDQTLTGQAAYGDWRQDRPGLRR
jgi:hypothetical protein